MTRKNIFKTLLFSVTAVTLSASCSFEQEDFFDESASLRITHLNEQLRTKLTNQSKDGNNGWIIQYFVAGTDEAKFEGFNLFANFHDNSKVTLAGNHRYLRGDNANKYTEASSSYEMLAEEGPVLSFNTWNDVLTVFEDPVSPTSAPKTIVPDGEGMHGDHNLVLVKNADNYIKFRGERHSAEVRFLPCDCSWQQYITDAETLKNRITSSELNYYYVTNGTDTLYMVGLNTGIIVYGDRIVDPLNKKTLSCVFTPKGFYLNHVDSLKQNAFQEFTLNSDQTRMLSEDGKTQVIPCFDRYVTSGPSDWRLDPALFTDSQKTLYAQMEAEVQKYNSSYVMDSIMIGNVVETGTANERITYPSLLVYAHGPARMGRTPVYKIAIDMNISLIGLGKVTFSQSTLNRTTSSMEPYMKTNLKSLCEQFAATLYGTYDIKPSDYFKPTTADLTPVSGGTPARLLLKPFTN